ALEKLGVESSTENVVLMVFSQRPTPRHQLEKLAGSILQGKEADSVIEISSREKLREICRAFDISTREMVASRLPSEEYLSLVTRLVLERSALLSIPG
ncbi:MAG TPA: hypothetical protein VE177_03860, partial [Candidatus Binatus sp.]|nr:hypothetical protein [Candidatus Binatus sp.]